MSSDRIEFYLDGKENPFCIVRSAFQPNDGDLVNIRGITYKVIGRSFTVDRAGEHDQSARCNVIVEKR